MTRQRRVPKPNLRYSPKDKGKSIEKEKPIQGKLHETITVGTNTICRTCFDREIEGEVITINAHTRMVVIRPTPILDQPMKSGLHMVNLDFVKDIRTMGMCMNKLREPNIFDSERLQTSMKEGVRKEQLVLPMEGRNSKKDMFTDEEHWSQNDADYKPNREQKQGSMACNITKIMNEGEIAQLDALYPMK